MIREEVKKIIIVDDHLLVREGMKSVLEATRRYQVIAAFADGTAFMERGFDQAADLILLDITLPGRSGLELIREVKRRTPDVPIIIVSMYAEEEFAVRSIRAGANGYISKTSPQDDILNAVDTVLKGGIYLTGTNRDRLYRQLNSEDDGYGRDAMAQLSDREQAVMVELCRGRTVKEISYDFGISNKTVSTYKSRIMEKLQMSSLTDLIKFGIEHRIV